MSRVSLCRLALLALLVMLSACATGNGDADSAFMTCDNGVVVYAGVDCQIVAFDADKLPETLQAEINDLRAEATADPSKALPNAQTIQRLLAAQPFQVCAALQSDPDGEFVKTPTIAPVAAALMADVCPALDS